MTTNDPQSTTEVTVFTDVAVQTDKGEWSLVLMDTGYWTLLLRLKSQTEQGEYNDMSWSTEIQQILQCLPHQYFLIHRN